MKNTFLMLGGMNLALAVPLALWDIKHGFLLVLLGAGIILTGVGLVLE